MSILTTAFAGMVAKMELENSLQHQKHEQLRPKQIQLEITKGLMAITDQLDADPKLKKLYDTVKVVVPSKA